MKSWTKTNDGLSGDKRHILYITVSTLEPPKDIQQSKLKVSPFIPSTQSPLMTVQVDWVLNSD